MAIQYVFAIGDEVEPRPEWRGAAAGMWSRDPLFVPSGKVVERQPWSRDGCYRVGTDARFFGAYVFQRKERTMSLQQDDAAAGAVAKGPRVTLADIENGIAMVSYINGEEIARVVENEIRLDAPVDVGALRIFTVCMIVMRNGFIVTGTSAPAAAENFDPELGRKFAYQAAIRDLWPLMGFALRDRLAALAHATSVE